MALVARQRELMVQQQTTATFLQSQIAALQHFAIADFSQSAAAQAAISGLQIQLYQTMNNSELKQVSQQLQTYQTILTASGALPINRTSLNAATSVASSQANSSISGRQRRIDQMFAPTSRPMSTSSKPSDKNLEPKQEPT